MRSFEDSTKYNPAIARELMAGQCSAGAQRVFTTVEPVAGAAPMLAPASWRATGDVTERAILSGRLRVVQRTNG